MKKVECEGSFNMNGVDISLGDIYNELLNNIHFVENYKSDIVHDIISLEKAIKNFKEGYEIVHWFGFRENGVDHYEYIHSSVIGDAIFGGNGEKVFKRESRYYYRKMFKLTIKTENNKIVAVLEEKGAYDFYKENKDKEVR